MKALFRVLLGIAVGYGLKLAVNACLTWAGIVPGDLPHENIRIISIIAAANLVTALVASFVCAWIAGPGRVVPATGGLMVAFIIGGVREGRHLVAAGQLPFSSAIITLLCVSLVPIGGVLYANLAQKSKHEGMKT